MCIHIECRFPRKTVRQVSTVTLQKSSGERCRGRVEVKYLWSNMTNSTPYEEDDARWCYEQRRAEVCVRSVMSYIYMYTINR